MEKIGGFRRSSISEDYDVVVRLALQGWRFFSFAEPVVFFRDHDTNRLSHCVHAKRFEEVARVYQRLLEEIRTSDSANSAELRNGLGSLAWMMGRRAARQGHQEIARQLFTIAEEAAGRGARKAKFPLTLLYYFLDPVDAEKHVEVYKRYFSALKNRLLR